MMGVFAEFERETIRERVTAGLARAKAKGTKSGNPMGCPAVSGDTEQRIRELRAQGARRPWAPGGHPLRSRCGGISIRSLK